MTCRAFGVRQIIMMLARRRLQRTPASQAAGLSGELDMRLLPDVGHMLMPESPDVCLETIRRSVVA